VVSFDRFNVPGWLASIDGQLTPIKPSGRLGLLSVPVPPGEHRIAVWYDGAPGDRAGIALSLVGLAAALVVAVGRSLRRVTILLSGTVIVGALVVLVVSRHIHQPTQLGGAADFGSTVRLVGASVDRPSAAQSSPLEINLWWQDLTRTSASCTVRLRLLDETGKVVARRDKAPLFGLRPCLAWQPGEIVHDLQEIELPPGVPPGTYRLAVGISLGDIDEDPEIAHSSVTWEEPAGSGASIRTGVDLGPVTIGPPPPESRIDGATPVGATVGQTWQLASARVRAISSSLTSPSADPRFLARLTPDDRLSADLLWRALGDASTDASVFTQLLDGAGNLVAQDDGWPDRWFSPTSTWFPGQTIVDGRVLTPKQPLAPGLYRLVVGMYDRQSMTRQLTEGPGASRDQVVLGTVKVSAANRIFGQPTAFEGRQVELDRQIRLLGGGVSPDHLRPGDTARVNLVWQATDRPQGDYTVFVHLMSGDGRLVAQHDRPPLDGALPTSAWDAGDTVYDSVDLAIPAAVPAGTYDVKIGLYRPADGTRLADPGGANEFGVGLLTVQ
jgi:hypothetical protein